jgi:hypothetical protein
VRLLGVLIGALAPLGTLVLAADLRAQVDDPRADERRSERSVSAGGQVRQQYERFANEEWGAEVPDSNGYWLQRYMLHLDARLSHHVRIYGELKSGIEAGRAGGPRPTDEDQLDLHQAFVEVSFGPLAAQLGRQELSFGSERLVSVREGPNVRQTFDGGRVVLEKGPWRIDGFGTRYVSTETGVFDDRSNTGRSLWGVYAVHSLADDPTIGIDVYYIGYQRNSATFDQGQGREVRHSWGARFWRTSTRLDYNVEAVIQAGRFSTTDIRAWSIALDAGYHIDTAPGRPRFGLRADITSGDRDRNDGRLGTFNPMFPKAAYFGLIAPAAPSNHVDLHPLVTVRARDDLVANVSWLFFWRNSSDDGIYGISGNLLRSGNGTHSSYVGQSPSFEAEWRATEHLSLTGNA